MDCSASPDPAARRYRTAPRLTIGRLMVAIAVIGAGLGLIQAYTFTTVIGLYAVALAAFAWLPACGRPRLASWGFFASAAWLNLSLPILYAWQPVFHKAIELFLASLIFVAVVPGVGLAWVASRSTRPKRVRGALLVAALTALPGSMLATRWPYYLGFYASSPALNRLADRVEAGGRVVPGEWAGIYRVWGSTTMAGGTVLLIDTKPGDRYGFARRGPRAIGRDALDAGRWSCLDED